MKGWIASHETWSGMTPSSEKFTSSWHGQCQYIYSERLRCMQMRIFLPFCSAKRQESCPTRKNCCLGANRCSQIPMQNAAFPKTFPCKAFLRKLWAWWGILTIANKRTRQLKQDQGCHAEMPFFHIPVWQLCKFHTSHKPQQSKPAE